MKGGGAYQRLGLLSAGRSGYGGLPVCSTRSRGTGWVGLQCREGAIAPSPLVQQMEWHGKTLALHALAVITYYLITYYLLRNYLLLLRRGLASPSPITRKP